MHLLLFGAFGGALPGTDSHLCFQAQAAPEPWRATFIEQFFI
jgi:hypothetical protein